MEYYMQKREDLSDRDILYDLAYAADSSVVDYAAHHFFFVVVIATCLLVFGGSFALMTGCKGWFWSLCLHGIIVATAFLLYHLVRLIIEQRKRKRVRLEAKEEAFLVRCETLVAAKEDARPAEGKRPYGVRLSPLDEWADFGKSLIFSCGTWYLDAPCFVHSDRYTMSITGAYQSAVIGDEYYVVFSRKNGRLLYAYPKKFFRYIGENDE